MARETVEFNGWTYYRYPDSDNATDRTYFKHGPNYLHRDVWKFHNGPIPTKHHIHHIDGNPANNNISNLQLLTISQHKRADIALNGLSQRFLQHLEDVRPLAAEWHSSPEGLKWHRQHAKTSIMGKPKTTKACEVCGKIYWAVFSRRNDQRFCSNSCKSQWRRISGADNEAFICKQCGAEFSANKYTTHKYCSRACAKAANGWRG